MRVLLVTPSDGHEGFEYVYSGRENLGVEYLLAALRADGHQAASRNENIRGATQDNPEWEALDLIGFSLPFWEYRRQYVDAINVVAQNTDAMLIAGGHASTLGAKYFLGKCPGLSGVVMGEGEETLCKLARCLDDGKDLSGVQGVMFREGYAPRTTLMPLDELTFPARDELRLSLDSGGCVKEALIESTRGCTYNCSFCSIPPYYEHAHGRRWRERSVANVCQELTTLVRDFPEVDLISFADDNFLGFNSNFHDRAIQIARHMYSMKPSLAFEIVCRVDAVEPEPFRELASLGMVGVYLGIESGVQRVLDTFKKKTTVEQNLRAIRILSDIGVGCDVGFITFSPDMTIPEVRQNLEFLQNIITNYPIFVHPAAVFRCLREYPKDLGQAALLGNDGIHLSSLNGPTNALYTTLDRVWREQYEKEFLRCEKLAATRNDDPMLLERQKTITTEMLRLAFALLREIEKRHHLTSKELLALSACTNLGAAE